MKHKRFLSFVISQSDDERVEFRFYPKTSDSFYHDYMWRILHFLYDDTDEDESKHKWQAPETIYELFEECSAIDRMSLCIKHAIKTKEVQPVFSIGNADWTIYPRKYSGEDYVYQFQIFDLDTDKGVRFLLDEEEALAFADFCEEIVAYIQDLNTTKGDN